jgi:hypothetical protein
VSFSELFSVNAILGLIVKLRELLDRRIKIHTSLYRSDLIFISICVFSTKTTRYKHIHFQQTVFIPYTEEVVQREQMGRFYVPFDLCLTVYIIPCWTDSLKKVTTAFSESLNTYSHHLNTFIYLFVGHLTTLAVARLHSPECVYD